jgi:dynein heavy chain
MQNIVVTNEEPAQMKKRNDAIIRKAFNEKKMRELEDRILNQISNSEVDILEDDVLVEILDDAKALYKQIEISMNESNQIIGHIQQLKEAFESVAKRVSRMFFVLIQIMNVNPMYQYSLKFFKMIYIRALGNAGPPSSGKKNERKIFFIKEFTKLLYENICRSLYEKDKLLFSFMMCLKIMYEVDGVLEPAEVRFLMTGGTRVEMSRPNPTGEDGWMSDKMWASIL